MEPKYLYFWSERNKSIIIDQDGKILSVDVWGINTEKDIKQALKDWKKYDADLRRWNRKLLKFIHTEEGMLSMEWLKGLWYGSEEKVGE